jgi:hypothetical protein
MHMKKCFCDKLGRFFQFVNGISSIKYNYTNMLPYTENIEILDPGANVIKLFPSELMYGPNKLECKSLASLPFHRSLMFVCKPRSLLE